MITKLEQIIKNCPLYEQYDYFNIGKCKKFQQPIYKGETKDIYIKNFLADEILNLLEIE